MHGGEEGCRQGHDAACTCSSIVGVCSYECARPGQLDLGDLPCKACMNPERVWLGVTVRVKGMDDRRAFGKQPCKWACLGRRLPRAFARAHAAPAHACGALRSGFALSGACRRTNVRA